MTTPPAGRPLPERIKRLQIDLGGLRAGALTRESRYHFAYAEPGDNQPAASLLMPPSTLVYEDGDLFPCMDMNLPEGFLFQRIMDRYPKRTLNKMHLLALMGDNGVGRIGYRWEGQPVPSRRTLSREELLQGRTNSSRLHEELVDAYLSISTGISGVQPKVLVPSRTTVPVPDLIVKWSGDDYPGLAANEYLCLTAARRAGIAVPRFELSHDGGLLVIDRFDIAADGARIGFEDIAALMGRQVHDRLSNRKYEGSYERVAEAIALFSAEPAQDLAAFFEQLALSVLVRNGDAHLKNFGMLYTHAQDARLAPLYDVVTTTIYTYQRPNGVEAVDRTLALKWRAGRNGNRAYPRTPELLEFGRRVCRVRDPRPVLDRVAAAMSDTLASAAGDTRIPAPLRTAMQTEWDAARA